MVAQASLPASSLRVRGCTRPRRADSNQFGGTGMFPLTDSDRQKCLPHQRRSSSQTCRRLSFFNLDQVIFIRIHQSLPTCVDDILADACGAEDLFAAVGAV